MPNTAIPRPSLRCSLILGMLKICWHPGHLLSEQPKFFCSVQNNLLCGNGNHITIIPCLKPKRKPNMSSLPLSALLEGVNAVSDGEMAHLIQDGLMHNMEQQWPSSSCWHHVPLIQQSSECPALSACGIFCLMSARTARQTYFKVGVSLLSLTETMSLCLQIL